jgi:hypothetical protein
MPGPDSLNLLHLLLDCAGDYRTLYARRKAELEERAAAAKERIAAAYQIANQDRESRKAKV